MIMTGLEQPQVKPRQAAVLQRQIPAQAANTWAVEFEGTGLVPPPVADWYSVGHAVNAIETITSTAPSYLALFDGDSADTTNQFFKPIGQTGEWIEAAREAYAGLFALGATPNLTLGLPLKAGTVEIPMGLQAQAVSSAKEAYWAAFAAQDHAAKLIEIGASHRHGVAVANQNVPAMYAPGPWGSWLAYVDAFERNAPEEDVLIEILKLSDGWDGEGSLAPSTEAAASAIEVFGRLSAYMAEAEIEVDGSTGEIGLTWYFEEHRSAVSVTILANGRVIVVSAPAGRPGWRGTLTPEQFDRLNRMVVDAGLHQIDG